MAATGLYYLNELDMYTTYGFVPYPGCSDDILKPRKNKERYFNDWAEDNGREYDLSEVPRKEDRVITLKGAIAAESEMDFWVKYNSLDAAFNTPGVKILKCNEFGANRDVQVFCLDFPEVNRLTRIKNTNKIFVNISIQLQEVQEGTVIPPVEGEVSFDPGALLIELVG